MSETIISYDDQNLFCFNLPTKPQPELGRILVTGASGYIGGRLVPELLARQYKVRVMLRAASPEYKVLWPQAEIVFADALEIDSLREAFEGIHTIYYLIHSLLLGPKHFEATDLKAAVNVAQAAKEKKVKRIIYLGGLGDVRSCISSHLRSRLLVAKQLKSSGIPVTLLRAAIIIGSGSASYEIVHHLVKRSRVLPMPNWGKTKCQPISIRDVIKYLVGVLESPKTIDKEYDIGGSDILSYGEMLKIFAKILNKKKFFFPSPISKPKYYAYLSSLLTPVPATICRCLMEGLKDEVICQNNNIKNIIKFEPISFKEAIIRAMTREEQDKVHTRWSDAYPPAHELAIKLNEIIEESQYLESHTILTSTDASLLFNAICRIGGKEGWLQHNWMWRIRGWIDRILMGVGTIRGRRSYSTLKINDVIDFWRVEDIQRNKRILLRAEMKVPGKAWLEFTIKPHKGENALSITAHYFTKSRFGRIYWYVFFPFHQIIFNGLLKQIEKNAK